MFNLKMNKCIKKNMIQELVNRFMKYNKFNEIWKCFLDEGSQTCHDLYERELSIINQEDNIKKLGNLELSFNAGSNIQFDSYKDKSNKWFHFQFDLYRDVINPGEKKIFKQLKEGKINIIQAYRKYIKIVDAYLYCIHYKNLPDDEDNWYFKNYNIPIECVNLLCQVLFWSFLYGEEYRITFTNDDKQQAIEDLYLSVSYILNDINYGLKLKQSLNKELKFIGNKEADSKEYFVKYFIDYYFLDNKPSFDTFITKGSYFKFNMYSAIKMYLTDSPHPIIKKQIKHLNCIFSNLLIFTDLMSNPYL